MKQVGEKSHRDKITVPEMYESSSAEDIKQWKRNKG